ncbi:MAG: CarD family transcriptional regulator [Lachnospiraceae bacterium]|nr:CarD family transcriptional regulator [Lachnospiraceae bacterium]
MAGLIGEYVVFGLHGVCEVIGTQTDEKDRSENYVLQPLSDKRCRLFVPMNNETALAKMKTLLSPEEAGRIMETIGTAADIWIVNENLRKEAYREIVKRGQREELMSLIRTLHQQQIEQKKLGRRLHRMDEKYFKDAKKILFGELAFILQKDPEEMDSIMEDKLGSGC